MKIISHKLTITSPGVNYFEAARIGAEQDFKYLILVRLYFHSREPLKKSAKY